MGSVMGEMSKCGFCGKMFIKSSGWIYKHQVTVDKDSHYTVSYCTYGCMRKAEKLEERDGIEKLDIKQVEYDFKERGSYIDMIASKHHVSIDTIESIVRNL